MSRSRTLDLDHLDQGIIKMLSGDAGLSNTALSHDLGVAKTTIGTRVKRLADQGIMRVVVETDVHAAGYPLFATVSIAVRGRAVSAVAADLAAIPEAIMVCSMLGRFQIVVHLIARDPEDLLGLLEERIANVAGVEETRSAMSLRMLRYASEYKVGMGSLRSLTGGGVDDRHGVLRKTALADRTDDLDLKILAFLQEDGRLSIREIARQVGVSDGTVRARVKRLDENKLLRRVAAVDPRALGRSHHALISLRVDPKQVMHAAAALAQMPQLTMVAIVLGEFEIHVSVSVGDRGELSRFINEQVGRVTGVRIHEVAEVVEAYRHDFFWAYFVD